MLYYSLKLLTRVAIRIFCRRIIINKPAMLTEEGPLLLASNHPNSFLDAVILDTLFNQPVYSLARGDVFVNRFARRILHSLHILPVYRVSEGVENLSTNYETFDACKQIFRKQGTILIFSEGKCINEWRLRPLKKGTARLAIDSWESGIPVKVLPVGINYSSFRRFGKNLILNFGTILRREDFDITLADGLRNQQFNARLNEELEKLVLSIDEGDREEQERLLAFKPPLSKKLLLFFPALVGWISHLPIYLPIKWITKKAAFHNDHYDSILVTLLLVTYPVYLVAGATFVYVKNGWPWSLLLLVLLPFSAWSLVQLKPQLDR